MAIMARDFGEATVVSYYVMSMKIFAAVFLILFFNNT